MDADIFNILIEDSDDNFKEIFNKLSLPKAVFDNEEHEDRLLKKLCLKMIFQYLDSQNSEEDSDSDVDQMNGMSEDATSNVSKIKRRVSSSSPRKKPRLSNKRKSSSKGNDPENLEFIDSEIDDEELEIFLKARKRRLSIAATKGKTPIARPRKMRPQDIYDNLTDQEFFKCLRVTKETFNFLWDHIQETKIFRGSSLGPNYQISAKLALEMFLHYMGRKSTFKTISNTHHISESAAMTNLMKVVEAINILADTEIVWPSSVEELTAIEKEYQEISSFPGVVGSLGECCIEMRASKEPPAGYKIGSQRSIMYLIAVTDAKLRFTYIQAGFPGTFSLHEAFSASSLGEALSSDAASLFPEADLHLIASPDFAIQKHVIVPFSGDSAKLNKSHVAFNEKLNKSYMAEKAFCRLKTRFGVFQSQLYSSLGKIPYIIKACCIIHNICLRDEKDFEFLKDDLIDSMEDYSRFREDTDVFAFKPDVDGLSKREELSKTF